LEDRNWRLSPQDERWGWVDPGSAGVLRPLPADLRCPRHRPVAPRAASRDLAGDGVPLVRAPAAAGRQVHDPVAQDRRRRWSRAVDGKGEAVSNSRCCPPCSWALPARSMTPPRLATATADRILKSA